MIDGWIIITCSFLYIGALFAVAYFGDRAGKKHFLAGRPYVYALTLGVYCTSWTFFGSVGSAAEKGFDFIAVYLGPIIAFTVAAPLLRRLILLNKGAEYNLHRRLHRGALRQEPRRRRHRDHCGGCWPAALYSAAVEGCVSGDRGPAWTTGGRRFDGPVARRKHGLPDRHYPGRFHGSFRRPGQRRHRAPARAHARNRGRSSS